MALYTRVPVFKGATRLPTFLGVPRGILIWSFIPCATLFMFIHFYAVILFALVFACEWSITKYDDRAFHVIKLALQTKLYSNLLGRQFKNVWGGSSRSPVRWKAKR